MKTANEFYQHHQADMLASAILMPRDEVLKIWRASQDVETLAEIFEVPLKAVLIRLEMLGIKI